MNRLSPLALLMVAGTACAQQYGPPPDYPPPPQLVQQVGNSYPKFTVPVVSATPAYKTEMFERRVCNQPPPPSDSQNAVGTVLGGVVGGVLGNQVGHGRGRTAATVLGAVGGAVAGNAISNNMQTGPDCRTVAEPQQVVVGYDVVYDFSGQKGHVRLPAKPGPSIVVEVRPAGL